jgi:dipeptidyl aminopeptidase/acylaminoacyl peptidase
MPRKKQFLTIEDLWSMKRVGAPTLSPDGRAACAAVTAYDMEKNDGDTELWLFPIDGSKARRLTSGDKDSGPQWSPDGKWIAFTAKRKEDEEPQIYLIAADGGEAVRLTTLAAGASALRWFPDSRNVAFVSWVWPDLRNEKEQAARRKERKDSKVKAHVTERSEYRYWDRTSLPPMSGRAARATCSRVPVSPSNPGIRPPNTSTSVPTGESLP